MTLNALASSLSATTSINTKQPNSAISKNGSSSDNFSQLLSKLLNDNNKYNQASSL